MEEIGESAVSINKCVEESQDTQEERTICTKGGAHNTSESPIRSKNELDIYDDENSFNDDDVVDTNKSASNYAH